MKLEQMCLVMVCENLSVIANVCQRNGWKVPNIVAEQIFDFFIEDDVLIDETKAKFFSKNIVSLKRVYSLNSIEICPLFFANLDKTSLEEVADDPEDDDLLVNLLTNTNGLRKIKMYRRHDNIDIFRLLGNSSRTLQEFHLYNETNFDAVSQLLESCVSLRYVTINLRNKFCNYSLKISKILRRSLRTIKGIYFDSVTLSPKEFVRTLNRCPMIEKIHLMNIDNFPVRFYDLFRQFNNRNNKIEMISVGYRGFSNFNAIDDIAIILDKFPKLLDLRLRFGNFPLTDNSILEKYKFNGIEKLVTLDIRGSYLTKKAFVDLGIVLENCTTLKALNLSNINLNRENFLHLMSLMSLSPSLSLEELDFEGSLFEETCMPLKQVLLLCSKLRRLNLSVNEKVGDGLITILEGLKNSRNSLIELKLLDCFLTQERLAALGDTLSHLRRIQCLQLDIKESVTNLNSLFNGLAASKDTIRDLVIFNYEGNDGMIEGYDQYIKLFDILRVSYEVNYIELTLINLKNERFYFKFAEAPQLLYKYLEGVFS